MSFDAKNREHLASLRSLLAAMDSRGTDVIVASACNAPTGAEVDRSEVLAVQLAAAVDVDEYAALPEAHRAAWFMFLSSCAGVAVPIRDSAVWGFITSIWKGGTTLGRLEALLKKQGASAVEQLFGEGTLITHLDIAAARAVE